MRARICIRRHRLLLTAHHHARLSTAPEAPFDCQSSQERQGLPEYASFPQSRQGISHKMEVHLRRHPVQPQVQTNAPVRCQNLVKGRDRQQYNLPWSKLLKQYDLSAGIDILAR